MIILGSWQPQLSSWSWSWSFWSSPWSFWSSSWSFWSQPRRGSQLVAARRGSHHTRTSLCYRYPCHQPCCHHQHQHRRRRRHHNLYHHNHNPPLMAFCVSRVFLYHVKILSRNVHCSRESAVAFQQRKVSNSNHIHRRTEVHTHHLLIFSFYLVVFKKWELAKLDVLWLFYNYYHMLYWLHIVYPQSRLHHKYNFQPNPSQTAWPIDHPDT